MGRYLLSGLLLLAFGALNALAAENPEKAAVGLGEVCDKKIGPLCKSGLDCNSAEPGKAGVCANATVPERSYRHHRNRSVKFNHREQKLRRPKLTASALPSKVGSFAMLLAMRRASSSVSTFAIWASFGFSRE